MHRNGAIAGRKMDLVFVVLLFIHLSHIIHRRFDSPDLCEHDTLFGTRKAIMQVIRLHLPHVVHPLMAVVVTSAACSWADASVHSFSDFANGSAPQQAAIELQDLDGSLHFTLTLGAWLPRLDGNVTLGSAATGTPGQRFELAQDFRLDDTEATVLPELAIRKRDIWEMHFSGFMFSTSASGFMNRDRSFGDMNFVSGDRFHHELDLISAAGEMRFGLFRAYTAQREDNRRADGSARVDFRFAPLIGLRFVEVDHAAQFEDMTERTGGTWMIPYGGFRMELSYFPDGALPLVRMLRLEAGAALGPALGGDGGFAWKVRAGLTWGITENVGLMFGYRLLELEVENGPYEFNGGLQGLYLAASLRF